MALSSGVFFLFFSDPFTAFLFLVSFSAPSSASSSSDSESQWLRPKLGRNNDSKELKKCPNKDLSKEAKGIGSDVIIDSKLTEKLSTTDPVKMQHANDHLGETIHVTSKDKNDSVINEENRNMSVSSTVNSSASANLHNKEGTG